MRSLETLAKRWGSTIVARSELSKFSGGLLNSRSIANLDSRGCGIPGKMRFGKKVFYPVDEVINFIKNKMEGAGT